MIEIGETQSKRLNVRHGEFAVTDDPHLCMFAVLGSCVATVLWDPVARIGGMNHILLPGVSDYNQVQLEILAAEGASPQAIRHRVHAMEILINSMLKLGAARHRLQAKVFGGAGIVPGLSDVGRQNITFVDHFLATEGIVLMARSVGGNLGRRLETWPTSGRARQKMVSDCPIEFDHALVAKSDPARVEDRLRRRSSTDTTDRRAVASGDLDLF